MCSPWAIICCSRERHQILATDQTADTTDVGVKHEQIGTVALAPEQTLAECRLELAVTPDELAVATDEKERVVDGLHLGARVEFVTANRNINVGFARRLTEAICVVAGDDKCRLAEAHARVDPGRYLRVPTLAPKGISADPNLRKDDQGGTILRRLADDCACPRNGLFSIKESGWHLCNGNLD
jgi:hypothetical protein